MSRLIGPQSARSAQLSDNSFIKINIRVVIDRKINDPGFRYDRNLHFE